MKYDEDWIRERLSQSRIQQARDQDPRYWDYKWLPGWKRDLSDKTFADYKRFYQKWRQSQNTKIYYWSGPRTKTNRYPKRQGNTFRYYKGWYPAGPQK